MHILSLPDEARARVLRGISWEDFLKLRLINKEYQKQLDALAGGSTTRALLKTWLRDVQGIQHAPAHWVVAVAASFKGHTTSDMLWRVIAEVRNLPLEPADDFITVIALLGLKGQVEGDAGYKNAVQQLVKEAGEDPAMFQLQYRHRISQLRPRLKTGYARATSSEASGEGLKLVDAMEGMLSPIFISEWTSVEGDSWLKLVQPDFLRLLKQRDNPTSGPRPQLRYAGFRQRVLGWLRTLASGFYGERLLVRLVDQLREKKKQLLIRPCPSIRENAKHGYYTLSRVADYNPGITLSLGADTAEASNCFLWSESRHDLAHTATAIREGRQAAARLGECLQIKCGSGTHVLVELEPFLDDSTRLPMQPVMAQMYKTRSSSRGQPLSLGCTLFALPLKQNGSNPIVPPPCLAETPVFLVVGHELIHALHDVTGTSTGLFAPMDPIFSNMEEERTIWGDGANQQPWDPVPLTENLLRSDHGFAPRISHGGKSQFQDAAGAVSRAFLQHMIRSQEERGQRISTARDQCRDAMEDPTQERIDAATKAVAALKDRKEFEDFLDLLGARAEDFEPLPDHLRKR